MITINKVYNRAGQPLFTLDDNPHGQYSNAGTLIKSLRNRFRELDSPWYEEYLKWALNTPEIIKIVYTMEEGEPVMEAYNKEGEEVLHDLEVAYIKSVLTGGN